MATARNAASDQPGGDALSARPALVAEQLCESAGLVAGWRVLAIGNGHGAVAAARRGCVAVIRADAESLPFPDASFDAVLSVFAAERVETAAELIRVCTRGGTIALASWMTEADLRHLLGSGIASLEVRERVFDAGSTYLEAVALTR